MENESGKWGGGGVKCRRLAETARYGTSDEEERRKVSTTIICDFRNKEESNNMLTYFYIKNMINSIQTMK